LCLYLCLLVQTKILCRRNNAEGVGVAHTSPPALDTDNRVALAQNTELDSVHDTPLEAAVDILLPWALLEVGLLLREEEGVYTTVQVGILQKSALVNLQ
jgi:hypothetical protein